MSDVVESPRIEQPAPPDAPKRNDEGGLFARLNRAPMAQKAMTPLAFLVVFVVYWFWLGSRFVDPASLLLDVHQNVPILLLGLAVLVTLIAGQFDLSVASMASLTNVLTIGLASQQGWSLSVIVVFCLGIGALGGLVNGLLVVELRVNAFIATLGTGGVMLGFSHVYSKGTTVTPTADGPQLPSWFTGPGSLGDFNTTAPSWLVWILAALVLVALAVRVRGARRGRLSPRRWDLLTAAVVVVVAALALLLHISSWVDGVSWTTVVLIGVAFVLWVVVNHTVFGRHLRATGSNPEAARLAGVPVRRQTISAFVIGGVIAAFAGIVFSAAQGSAAVDSAVGFLLPGFAAAFLSTVVFSAGAFTVWGTILGGTFLNWVALGLILGGLDFTWTDVVNGIVLLAAVSISTIRHRRTR